MQLNEGLFRVRRFRGIPYAAPPTGERRWQPPQPASSGRLVKTRLPSGAERTVGYGLEQRDGENLVRTEVREGTGAVTQTVADRLGRPVIERFKGFDGAMRERVKTYQPEGFLSAETTFHPVGDTQTEKITYKYDDLGRMLERREPDAGKPRTWSYDGVTTTYTDTRGGVHTTTEDDRGLVVEQKDGVSDGNETQRVYRYGAFGTLTSTKVTGADASAAAYTYDDQGAMISSIDRERGATSNGYNAFGELISRTDALGRTTAVTYDVLGRETTRTVAKGGTVRSVLTHTWDTAKLAS